MNVKVVNKPIQMPSVEMKIKVNDYEPRDIMKFIREYSGLNQSEFARQIGKSRDWQQSCELGRINYKFIDLLRVAKKYDLEIIIQSKKHK